MNSWWIKLECTDSIRGNSEQRSKRWNGDLVGWRTCSGDGRVINIGWKMGGTYNHYVYLHCRSAFTLTFLFISCFIKNPHVCVSWFWLMLWLVGFCATYTKLYPTFKPYEYGFRMFLITYCFISVSGYQTGEFVDIAINRFVLIALGAAVSLGINICIYPIWAGEDLHNLVTKNFMGVATSLEGILHHHISFPVTTI